MKRELILISILLLLCAGNYADEFRLKQIDLDMEYSLDKEIYNNYGNLWIGYQISEKSYKLFGGEFTPIPIIEVYYKKNNNYIYLGKIDTSGIYDKDNKLICENILLSQRFEGDTPLGMTENSLIDPFHTAQYVLTKEGNFGGLDPYARITINFKTNSLELIRKIQ